MFSHQNGYKLVEVTNRKIHGKFQIFGNCATHTLTHPHTHKHTYKQWVKDEITR